MNFTLITGASKGIGRALAREFASCGCNLLLIARSGNELEALAKELRQDYKVVVKAIVMDLSRKNASTDLFQYCLDNSLQIQVLVNNAGHAIWKPFEESTIEEQLSMIQLNQQVMLELCHLFIPMLRNSPDAHILNVASTAAFQPLPNFSTYAASKAFVYSFTRSLRYELKNAEINVSCLCPGPTDTEFFSSANFKHKVIDTDGIKMPVEEVARKTVADLLAKKAVIIPGFSNKLGVLISRYLPVRFTSSLLGKLVPYKQEEEV